jgi:hypothetical protein
MGCTYVLGDELFGENGLDHDGSNDHGASFDDC